MSVCEIAADGHVFFYLFLNFTIFFYCRLLPDVCYSSELCVSCASNSGAEHAPQDIQAIPVLHAAMYPRLPGTCCGGGGHRGLGHPGIQIKTL